MYAAFSTYCQWDSCRTRGSFAAFRALHGLDLVVSGVYRLGVTETRSLCDFARGRQSVYECDCRAPRGGSAPGPSSSSIFSRRSSSRADNIESLNEDIETSTDRQTDRAKDNARGKKRAGKTADVKPGPVVESVRRGLCWDGGVT